jgi:5-methylcytosine-specific restriction endonuclease McrA
MSSQTTQSLEEPYIQTIPRLSTAHVTPVLQNSVVVFSKNYLPLARVNLRRAVTLLVTGQAETLDFNSSRSWLVRSPSLVLQVSEHIRLTQTNPERHWKIPAPSRREVLRRDGHTCQYCGSNKRLTLDHVMPRSRGGRDTWENLVAACESCNTRKGNRTPQEAAMLLKTKPKAPMHPAIAFAEQFWHQSTTAEVNA